MGRKKKPVTSHVEILTEIHAYVGLLFQLLDAEGETDKTIAEGTGLSVTTVWNYRQGRYLFPRYETLARFGKYAGVHLIWVENQPRIKVSKRAA